MTTTFPIAGEEMSSVLEIWQSRSVVVKGQERDSVHTWNFFSLQKPNDDYMEVNRFNDRHKDLLDFID